MTKTKITKTTIYWIATLFVACIMTISGVLALIHSPDMMTALAHLGYPPYFSNLLGVSKLVGVSVLLVPGIARFKEWAYVGFEDSASPSSAPPTPICSPVTASSHSSHWSRLPH